MTGIEDELLDIDANMRQPDEGLTAERRAADLLRECLEAMSEATRRYRTMAGLSGNSTEVPGWVAWLDQMQVKIRESSSR